MGIYQNGISNAVENIRTFTETLPNAGREMLDFSRSYRTNLLVLEDIVRGLWNGIKSMGNWLKDKMSSFASGIVKDVKSFLVYIVLAVYSEMK